MDKPCCASVSLLWEIDSTSFIWLLGSQHKENAQKNAWHLNSYPLDRSIRPQTQSILVLQTQDELKHDSQVVSVFQQTWDLDSAFYCVAEEKLYNHSELLYSLVCKIGLITCLPEHLVGAGKQKSWSRLFPHQLFQWAGPLACNGAGEWHGNSSFSFMFLPNPSPHPPLCS